LFGIRIRLEGKVPLDSSRLLVVANHFSYLDIPILAAALPLDLHFVAKSELLRIPFFRHFFRTMDIAIPRGSAQGSVKAYKRAEAFWTRGSAVVVFPEGGILAQAPQMTPFRVSPFAMALQQGATILPVSLPDTWKILPECPYHFLRPGLCRVRLLESLEVTQLNTDERSLRNLCFDSIAEDLSRTAPIEITTPI
jgi:1-acyl-sn-glycerol-3-phosphate acyltransferase